MRNIKRKTKIKIRKILSAIRAISLGLFGLFLFLGICSVDNPKLIYPLIFFGIGFISFGISYAIDWLLVETAWRGDSPSFFN